MATLYLHFPNTEAIAGVALRNAGFKAGSSLPPKNTVWPFITVKRLGGVPQDKYMLDRANLQIDVWGNNKSDAHSTAQAARRVLHALEGTTSSDFNGVITCVEDSLGLFWLPDQETKRDRYIFSVMVYAKQYMPITT